MPPELRGRAKLAEEARYQAENFGGAYPELSQLLGDVADAFERPVPMAALQLMDAGLAFAQRMRVELKRSGAEDIARFALPIWVDQDASVRVALPVADPTHGTDAVQLIVPMGELLAAVGRAWSERSRDGTA